MPVQKSDSRYLRSSSFICSMWDFTIFSFCILSSALQKCSGNPVVTSVVHCDPNLSYHKIEVQQPKIISNRVLGRSGTTHESQLLDPNMVNAVYHAECSHLPPVPAFSKLTCNVASGSCQASCHNNYQFPNGESTMYLTCQNNNWLIHGADWKTLPPCKPICQPECQNGGICTSPNRCSCSPNFNGAQCEIEDRVCSIYPNTPMNSRKQCTQRSCTVKCLAGTKFPNSLSETEFVCRNGTWISNNVDFDWENIPNCDVTCNPPCRNGGRCLSNNRCQCQKEFRGLQCQYSIDRCSLRNLQFNGSRMCNGTSEYLTCSLYCPSEMSFTFAPADRYTCYYETGFFSPSNVPQCQFGQRYIANGSSG
ncbi:neurogenic locus notch homolog protein 2-like [Neocloeon triangulifer]|uniref:neurogenic locus notch homolog protein 2-like n=1 Tax=Neocloeon triangulifer TaxID=2078957 RepID=UPI00286EF1EE|nr:neurogenic locus notch homolog protein 2-like [Neocloeon triangulifer]